MFGHTHTVQNVSRTTDSLKDRRSHLLHLSHIITTLSVHQRAGIALRQSGQGWYRTCFWDVTPPPRDGSAEATVSLVKPELEMQGPMKPVGLACRLAKLSPEGFALGGELEFCDDEKQVNLVWDLV
ncbi:unnamed protein product [Leuciscus chuanchicus]